MWLPAHAEHDTGTFSRHDRLSFTKQRCSSAVRHCRWVYFPRRCRLPQLITHAATARRPVIVSPRVGHASRADPPAGIADSPAAKGCRPDLRAAAGKHDRRAFTMPAVPRRGRHHLAAPLRDYISPRRCGNAVLDAASTSAVSRRRFRHRARTRSRPVSCAEPAARVEQRQRIGEDRLPRSRQHRAGTRRG